MHRFLNKLLEEEILPTVDASDTLNPEHYVAQTLTRFKNRHIQHLLSQIAWDGSQKLPPRLLNTVKDNLAANRSIHLLSATVAAWIIFVIRSVQTNKKLVDPMDEVLIGVVKNHDGEVSGVANALLEDSRIFGDL